MRGGYSAREHARRHAIGQLQIDSSQFTHYSEQTGGRAKECVHGAQCTAT